MSPKSAKKNTIVAIEVVTRTTRGLTLVPSPPQLKISAQDVRDVFNKVTKSNEEVEKLKNAGFLKKLCWSASGKKTEILTGAIQAQGDLTQINTRMITYIGELSQHSQHIHSVIISQQEAIHEQNERIESAAKNSEEGIIKVGQFAKDIYPLVESIAKKNQSIESNVAKIDIQVKKNSDHIESTDNIVGNIGIRLGFIEAKIVESKLEMSNLNEEFFNLQNKIQQEISNIQDSQKVSADYLKAQLESMKRIILFLSIIMSAMLIYYIGSNR